MCVLPKAMLYKQKKNQFYQKFLNVTQYAHLIVWVPRKGVKLV